MFISPNTIRLKNIFFITGASGVGKTSLVKGLKNKYSKNDDWVFLHFDDIGVPVLEEMVKKFGSGENWQEEMTYKWIGKMLNEYQNKDVVIIEGQVNLKFIQDGFSQEGFSNYEIVLIDCNEEIMGRRLAYERNQPELLHEDMRNWLQYLRNQANDCDVNIIDTSNITKEDTMKSFKKILKKRIYFSCNE
jgi:GTPase SAR1 family protein